MIKYNFGKSGGQFCFSFDDYHPSNIQIAELFLKFNLNCTFFIETGTQDARVQIRKLSEMGFDIGAHTIHHPSDLKTLHGVECMSEIEGSKKMVEAITNVPCESFAYPRGRHNPDVVAMVKQAGFKDARTTIVLKTNSECDPFTTPTALHIFDGRKEYVGRSTEALFDFYYEDIKKNGGLLSVWGHASELDRDNNWNLLEYMIRKLIK